MFKPKNKINREEACELRHNKGLTIEKLDDWNRQWNFIIELSAKI